MFKPGDRRCTCYGKMKPIALTYKPENNVFSKNRTFELMLVHECTKCGALSKNRIAGDDNEYSIEKVFFESLSLPIEKINKLNQLGFDIFLSDDKKEVMNSLYGVTRDN